MSSKPFHVWQYHHSGDSCVHNRLLLPARYCGDKLLAEGIKVSTNSGIPNSGLPTGGDTFDSFVYHGLPEGTERIIGIGTRWQMEGKSLVWSVDDDYRCIPSWNPVQISTAMTTVAVWSARSVNHVIASTRTLADTMSPRPVNVAPNLLELPLYKPWPRDDDRIRIMFAGSNTHLGDLEQVVDAVTATLAKYPQVDYRFMGCLHPEIRRRHLYNGVIEWPMAPMKDYWSVLAEYAPDIWVCPLVDCTFNCSKSNLKVVEGLALECAVVASDVQPYRDTITSGVDGILVDPEDGGAEWTEALSMLIEDAAMRKRLAAAGRQLVEDKYNWHSDRCIQPWMDYYRSLRVPF